MGIGAGLLTGVQTAFNVDFTPDGDEYLDNTGSVFHPQDEAGGGNVAFYEIQDTTDTISIDIQSPVEAIDNPVLTLYTAFGPTDFTVEEYDSGNVIVSEQSGFNTDVWHIDLSGTSGQYTITDFDTAAGVDGTQAGWLPYANLESLLDY